MTSGEVAVLLIASFRPHSSYAYGGPLKQVEADLRDLRFLIIFL